MKNPTQSTKRFGLIGHPIGHSMSPALFRAGYSGRYRYDLIEGGDFMESYRKFTEEYDGINVTAPFKEKAFAEAGWRSPECVKIGATNLMVRTPEGIKAYNSDYTGVIMSLKEYARGLSTALVVGCGGAGKAAAVAAGDMGLEVTLMNRTPERAGDIIAALPEYGFRTCPAAGFRECFRESDIVIYTLPVTLPEISLLDGMDFRGGTPRGRRKIIFEANYRSPSFTGEILERMTAANSMATYIPGQVWLLNQAAAGYSIFTGEEPDLAAMEKVIL